jgi:hypothetical protein
MGELAVLSLAGTSATEKSIGVYCRSQLQSLKLSETSLSDAGLLQLARCKNLTELHVRGTQVTQPGIATFRHSAPHIKIED